MIISMEFAVVIGAVLGVVAFAVSILLENKGEL